jgi:CRP-like cAMP-binding protein
MRTEAEAALLAAGWLAGIGGPLQSRILADGKILFLKPGDALAQAGDEQGGIFGIASGVVASRPAMAPPDIAMADVHHPPFWFVSRTHLPGQSRVMSVSALTPTVALFVPQLRVMALVEEFPEFRHHLFRNVSTLFALLSLSLADALMRNSDQRLLAVLLRAAGCRFEGDDPAQAPIVQADLAGMANVSRQKAGDVLRALAREGLVETGYRAITVLKPAHLRARLEV